MSGAVFGKIAGEQQPANHAQTESRQENRMSRQTEQAVYDRQGFGKNLELAPPAGLLIVDFINGFADPEVFGGGNIRPAIEKTGKLLALARNGAGWSAIPGWCTPATVPTPTCLPTRCRGAWILPKPPNSAR